MIGKLPGGGKAKPFKRPGTLVTRTAVSDGVNGPVLDENTKHERTYPIEGAANVGFSFGMTIPGPEKSYLSARVEVSVQLPSREDDSSIRATLARASALVEEKLDAEIADVSSYFDQWLILQGRK